MAEQLPAHEEKFIRNYIELECGTIGLAAWKSIASVLEAVQVGPSPLLCLH